MTSSVIELFGFTFICEEEDDPQVWHIYCCNENQAICGVDVSDHEDADAIDGVDIPCVVCDDLQYVPCKLCGG